MKLSRLIYKSIATAEVISNRTLRDLEDQASAENSKRGITGLLVLTGNVFLQVLEGSAQEVTGLFARIAADKRHRAVELVTFQAISQRSFDDWNMRLVDLYDLPGEKRALMVAKYGNKDGDIMLPDDEHQVHAFLFDGKYLCGTAPWKSTRGSDGAPAAATRTSP